MLLRWRLGFRTYKGFGLIRVFGALRGNPLLSKSVIHPVLKPDFCSKMREWGTPLQSMIVISSRQAAWLLSPLTQAYPALHGGALARDPSTQSTSQPKKTNSQTPSPEQPLTKPTQNPLLTWKCCDYKTEPCGTVLRTGSGSNTKTKPYPENKNNPKTQSLNTLNAEHLHPEP